MPILLGEGMRFSTVGEDVSFSYQHHNQWQFFELVYLGGNEDRLKQIVKAKPMFCRRDDEFWGTN